MTDPPDTTAGRSPFPPIADYGFLSDCETTALVAPERQRRVDVPAPDGLAQRVRRDPRPRRRRLPARSGRRAGPGRAAATCPGTMVLETSWGTPTGWIIVRDVLLIGPWHHDERAVAHPPPRADRLRRRPRAAAHRPLRQRRGAGRARLRADVRLRPAAGDGTTATPATTRASATRRGRGPELTLTTDLRLGFEGGRAMARTLLKEGDVRFCALSWSEHEPPHTYERGVPAAGLDRAPLAALAGPRPLPRPSLAAATCSAAPSRSRA